MCTVLLLPGVNPILVNKYINIKYLSGSLVQEPSLQVLLLSSHAEGRPVSRAFFYLSKSPVKDTLSSLLLGPLWREMLISRAFFHSSLRVSGKGAPPSRFPPKASVERDTPFPQPSFTCLSDFPVKQPPPLLGSPESSNGDMSVFRAFFYICLGDPNEQILLMKIKSHLGEKVPDKEATFLCSLDGASIERDAYFRNLLVLISRRTWCWSCLNGQPLSKFSVKDPPSRLPQRSHQWGGIPLSRAFFYISLYPEKRRASF
jgi:hypothetical protein